MADRPTVVVGGGIIGLACAYELAATGRQVQVLDRAPLGRGASTGNAGWVTLSQCFPVPSPAAVRDALRSAGRPDSPLYVRPGRSSHLTRWLWRFARHSTPRAFAHGTGALGAFAERSFEMYDVWEKNGVATTLTRPGLVHAFLDPREADRSLRLQTRTARGRYQVPGRPLTGEDVHRLEPALVPDVRAAYLVPEEGLVDPRRLVASLAHQVTAMGGTIADRTPVTRVTTEDGKVRVVHTGQGPIECSELVIAAGAWAGDLLDQLGVPVQLQAGKGYSFSVNLPTPPRHPLLLADKHVAVSPLGDTTRIAGTMEFSGNNLRLDWRRIEAIARASRHYLGHWFATTDELVGLISDPWVGGRPMLPDGLPLIDRVPGLDNAYVATGHGMLGVTLAPATATAVTHYVVTGRRPTTLAPFQFARFR